MWNIYLRGSEHKQSGGSAPAPQYAAPLHRETFAGLPPAWVELAEFDPLRDEGRQYAEALQAAANRYAGLLEKYARMAPYNWFNFYDFWAGT